MTMLFSRIHDRVAWCQIRSSFHRLFFARRAIFFTFTIVLAPAFFVGAQATSAYELGIEAYVHNRPAEAAAYFETLVESGSPSAEIYLYLGLVYEQMGLYDRALELLDQAKSRFPNSAAQVYFNKGNIYLTQGKKEESLASYTQAISLRRSYPAPYLNRANTLVSLGDLQPALADYKLFLQFDPMNALAPQVRQMIAAIEAEFTAQQAAEVARQAEERMRELETQAEAERQVREAEVRAQEAVRQAQVAEDRRRDLLNSVFNSLGAASSTATGLGAGADSVIEVDEEITIDSD